MSTKFLAIPLIDEGLGRCYRRIMRYVFSTIGCAILLGLAVDTGDSAFLLPAEPDEFDRREVEAYYDWRNNMFFRVFKLASMEGKPIKSEQTRSRWSV